MTTFASMLERPDVPLNLQNKNVHFVGIGGSGMSGLARIVRAAGACCSGTDGQASPVTAALERDGIPVGLQQGEAAIPEACDLLVASAAIAASHPEMVEAKRRGIPVFKYARMLGRLMLGRTGVAIAGTHGKSSTTSMTAHILIQSGLDPTFIVGATCEQIGGGSRVGRPDVLLAEACEYDRSFHNFHPAHSVILNVEEDHMDIYASLDEILESFRRFASLTAPEGSLLIGHEGAYRSNVAAGCEASVQTIGFAPQADWVVEAEQRGSVQRVQILHDGQVVCRFDCLLPGEHMAYNASVAAVTAHRLGAGWDQIARALSCFRGLDRRMQPVGERNGVQVIDDYGHHPTEIDATLRALRAAYRPQDRGGRLICVFQPHQHSRTRFLLEQFATSFADADIVIVPHIYFVRDSEEDRRAVSAVDLVRRLHARGTIAEHIDAFSDIVEHLHGITRPGDLLVVMGAGPVWTIGRDFLKGPSVSVTPGAGN